MHLAIAARSFVLTRVASSDCWPSRHVVSVMRVLGCARIILANSDGPCLSNTARQPSLQGVVVSTVPFDPTEGNSPGIISPQNKGGFCSNV